MVQVINVARQRYNVGTRSLAPQPLTENTYTEVDIQPLDDLPVGVNVTYRFEHSTDGGANWFTDASAPITGLISAADWAAWPIAVGLEVRIPNWQERLSFTISGAAWTTAFTITIDTRVLT